MPTETVSARTYVKTFAALMGLLVLTVGANFVHLGPFNTTAAMLIAGTKAVLIILFFMEVRYSRPIVWLFALSGFVWFLIMILMMMADYTTRDWVGPHWRDANDGQNHVEFARPYRAPGR